MIHEIPKSNRAQYVHTCVCVYVSVQCIEGLAKVISGLGQIERTDASLCSKNPIFPQPFLPP